MMQGLSPRGEVRRKHGTNVRVDGQKPNRRRPYRTSGQRTAKSIIHQGAKRRFGDCARKVTELTPGDLFRVASATEVGQCIAPMSGGLPGSSGAPNASCEPGSGTRSPRPIACDPASGRKSQSSFGSMKSSSFAAAR